MQLRKNGPSNTAAVSLLSNWNAPITHFRLHSKICRTATDDFLAMLPLVLSIKLPDGEEKKEYIEFDSKTSDRQAA
jgi:hypothetical protein